MNHLSRRLNDLLRSFALALVLPAWLAVGQEATSSASSPKNTENVYRVQQEARWGTAAFMTPYAFNISDSDKLAGLSLLWAQAKFGFANFWHVPQLNWDLTYRNFIPKVLATHSTAEYYRTLQSFYALLEDGHTAVYLPKDVNTTYMPFRTRLVDDRLLVLSAMRPDFSLQGLQPGDEIVTINGEPAAAWARTHVEPFVSASTPQDRVNRTYGFNLFSAPEGTTFHLTTSTPSGVHADLSFTVPPYAAASHRPKFQFQILPGNIAYVQLNDFEDDTDQKEWDEHWPEISKASALILDLRENGGGDESIGEHIMATLINKPVPGERSRSTQWIATYRAWERDQTFVDLPVVTVVPDPARYFAGPVALLISPRTFSAAEDMTVVFAQAHRGPMIGEPTAGSTGQPLFVKLPGGGAARFCTKHDSFADGREFVGVGIQPDIVIRVTRADIIAKHDPVVEKAIEALLTKR